VRAVIRWASRDKALRQAAAGTPEMELAVRLYARRQVVRQHASLSALAWLGKIRLVPRAYFDDQFWEDLAPSGGEILPTQGPVLKAIEAPVIEDPAA